MKTVAYILQATVFNLYLHGIFVKNLIIIGMMRSTGESDFEAEATLGEIGVVVEIAEKVLPGIVAKNSCEIAGMESYI